MPLDLKIVYLYYSASSCPTNLFCKASSQLSTRLDISMVTVIGPTPPGTGVNFATFYKVSSFSSTSPVIKVSTSPSDYSLSTKLIPTSMTTASFLIHDDLTSPGTPHAAITTSAYSTVAFKTSSGVFEKHT